MLSQNIITNPNIIVGDYTYYDVFQKTKPGIVCDREFYIFIWYLHCSCNLHKFKMSDKVMQAKTLKRRSCIIKKNSGDKIHLFNEKRKPRLTLKFNGFSL